MPRKKQEKLVEEEEEFEVDEPSEVEELENNATDDDWTPADEEKKPGRPQRAARARKPVKLADGKTTSDEDDDEEEEEDEEQEAKGVKRKRTTNSAVRGGRGRGRGRPPVAPKKVKTDENGKGRGKKKDTAAEEQLEGEGDEDEMEDVDDEEGIDDEEDSVSEEEESDEDSETEDLEIPPEFKSGKFVLLKSDFDNKEENYPLWKIDGKSLLQKFDKFVHNDEELYKGTTIYAGWSKAVIHTYYPITVEQRTVGIGGETTVKFDPSQITPEMQAASKEQNTATSGEGAASGADLDKSADDESAATNLDAEGEGEPEE